MSANRGTIAAESESLEVALPLDDAPAPTLIECHDTRYVLLPVPHAPDDAAAWTDQALAAHGANSVCVDLCSTRLTILSDRGAWHDLDIVSVIRRKRVPLLLAGLGLSVYLQRLGRPQGRIGDTLRAVTHQAQSHGLPVRLIDRDIEVTLSRAWRRLTLRMKAVLALLLLRGLLRPRPPSDAAAARLAETDPFEGALAALLGKMPALTDILVGERAQLSARAVRTAPGRTVLVLLGPGRVRAVAEALCRDAPLPEEAPAARRPVPAWVWLVLTAAVVLLPAWYYRDSLPLGSMLRIWLLTNAGCVAVTTTLAGARPFTILAAMVAAPFSLFNPLIKAATVAGLCEALQRKPRVADADDLPYDLRSWSRFRRNPFCRILLVFVAGSTGSFLGTWLSAFWMAHLVSG